MVDMENVPGDQIRERSRQSVRNAWPPTDKTHIGRWTLETSAELRLLRVALHHAILRLPGDAASETVRERVAIVANELAANAIAHAIAPATVELSRTETTFIIDVSDNDPWAAPRLAEVRPGMGGLGLDMACRLSLDMGWYLDGGTKCVWAQVPISVAGRGPGDES